MLNFEALPKDKPSQNNVTKGRYKAKVFKTQMMKSKTTNEEYLNVSFKINDGGFVNENYFDSDKTFLMYKLGRLLKACKVSLKGEGSLKDVAKVIANKEVIIDVDVNDRGYGCLDYSGANEGIYALDEVSSATNTTNTTEDLGQSIAVEDAEVQEAIETVVEDEDF